MGWKECKNCGNEFLPFENEHEVCELCEEEEVELEEEEPDFNEDDEDQEWPN